MSDTTLGQPILVAHNLRTYKTLRVFASIEAQAAYAPSKHDALLPQGIVGPTSRRIGLEQIANDLEVEARPSEAVDLKSRSSVSTPKALSFVSQC